MLDLSIYLLQLVSLLITSLLGLVGIIYDFKDPSGKLTVIGHRVVLGIVASSLVSVVASGLDFYKRNQDEQRNLQQTRRLLATTHGILKDVNRGLRPIRTVKCQLSLLLDSRVNEVAALRQQLQAFVAAQPASSAKSQTREGILIERDATGRIVELTVTSASRYFSRPNQAPHVGNLLASPSISLDLFRAHQPLGKTYVPDKGVGMFMKREADLALQLIRKPDEPATIIYDMEDEQLYVELIAVRDESEDFPNMGSISSTLDLTHAQAGLIISYPAGSAQDPRFVVKAIDDFVLSISGKAYYVDTELVEQQRIGLSQALLFDLDKTES